MADNKSIDVRVQTGNRSKAGTRGEVYLGIGGRVFLLDTNRAKDFAAGAETDFRLASEESSNMYHYFSDPTKPWPLTTENVEKFGSVWMLFIPAGKVVRGPKGDESVRTEGDTWNVEYVEVTVNTSLGPIKRYTALSGEAANQWLGVDKGQSWFELTES